MTQRYRALPRAIQWAGLAAVGFVLFMLWDSILEPQRKDFDARVQSIQGQVAQVRNVQSDYNLDRANLQELIQTMGQVDAPRDQTTTSKSVHDLINSLIKKHGATNESFGLRLTGFLPQTALGPVAGGKRVERLTCDLKFEAKPESAAAFIAELEASPDIELVNSVRLTKDTGGKVKVQLVCEAWVYSRQAQTAEPAL